MALWCGRPDPEREDGITVTEVAIATGIFAIVVILLTAMLATGMRGVLLGKRREVATQEVNKVLELARSLSYDEVGLAQGDPTITTDTAIVDQGGVLKFLVDPAASQWEPIEWATTPGGHVYSPHTVSLERGSSDLTRSVYVTGVDTNGDGNADMKRVTARVVWNNSGTAGYTDEIRSETLIDENGVVGVGSGSPMSASANSASGSFSLRTDRGDLAALLDAVLPADPVVGTLPSSTGETTLRAVAHVSCSSTATSLEYGSVSYGGQTVDATADDDAATGVPPTSSPAPWSGSTAVGGGGLIDQLLSEGSIGGSASCYATAADADGIDPMDDNLPYEKGTATGTGSITSIEDVSGAGLGTDTLTVTRVDDSSVSQEVDHAVAGGEREIASISAGSLGETDILAIPGHFGDGLVSVDAFSYEATTVASAGTPSSAPTITAPSGIEIQIFDPNSVIPAGNCDSRSGGYCRVNVDPGAGDSLNVSFSSSVTANLGLTTLSWETHVQAFPPKVDPLSGIVGANGERRWEASYTGIRITSRLKVFVDVLGVTVLLTDSEAIASLVNVSSRGCAGVGCA